MSSGTLKRGNAKNGILVTNGARANLIGGQATGGNDPTAGVIVRPPQGNLISGNRGNGVLINDGPRRRCCPGTSSARPPRAIRPWATARTAWRS